MPDPEIKQITARAGPAESPRGPATTRWEGPLFVLGMPRSGSKLLRALLTRHPAIRIPRVETEFLPFLAQWVRRYGPPEDEGSFRRLYEILRRGFYFEFRDSATGPFSWREWRAACRGRLDAPGLFEGFVRYETHASCGSGIIWGDKSPTYIEHIAWLLREFPSAKVIHIIRDVRDYCVSIRSAWGKDVRRAAQRWRIHVLEAHKHLEREPTRLIEVKYEDLVSGPAVQLERVCSFLGIGYEPEMAHVDSPVENLGDAKGRAGIVADNFGKYKQRLSRSELAAIESLAWETMISLGYAPEVAAGPKSLSEVALAVLRLKDGVRMVLRDAENRGLLRTCYAYVRHQRISGSSI